jgi:KDO2-lipid IV(A) lauroyltransferase
MAEAGFSGMEKGGRLLGNLMWKGLGKRREHTVRTVSDRLEVDRDTAVRIGRESFVHSARSFLEIFLTRSVDHRFMHSRLEQADPDMTRRFMSCERPIVGATGHLGAWELEVGLLNILFGTGRPKQVVVRLPRDRALGRLIMHLRTQPGVEIVPHRDAAPKALGCLRQNGVTAFLVDHNCRRNEALFLPFLGREAAVNMGPALLAVRSRAMVWPVFLTREPEGRYRSHVLSPLDTRELSGSTRDRVRKTAEFYTRAVETMVRRYPEQWFWMHNRWKTRPQE